MKKSSLFALQNSLYQSQGLAYAKIKKKKKKEGDNREIESEEIEVSQEELDEMTLAVLQFFFDEQLHAPQLNDQLRALAGKVLYEAQKASEAMDWVPRPQGPNINYKTVLKEAAKAIIRKMKRGSSDNFGKITRANLDNARIYKTVRERVAINFRSEYEMAKAGLSISLSQYSREPIPKRLMTNFYRAQGGMPAPEVIKIIPRRYEEQDNQFIVDLLNYFYSMPLVPAMVTDGHRDLAAKLIWAASVKSAALEKLPTPTNGTPSKEWLFKPDVQIKVVGIIQQDTYADAKLQVAEDFKAEYKKLQNPNTKPLPGISESKPLSYTDYGYPMQSLLPFQIPGPHFPKKQTSSLTCWATHVTILHSWGKGKALTEKQLIPSFGGIFAKKLQKNELLTRTEEADLYKMARLAVTQKSQPTAQDFAQLMQNHGPLIIPIDNTSVNAKPHFGSTINSYILIGITVSDVLYIDPADGKTKSMPFKDFRHLYDGVNSGPFNIIHFEQNQQHRFLQSSNYSYQYDLPRGIFSQEAMDRMKDFLVDNASQSTPCNCIDTMNKAVKKLLDKNDLKLGSAVHTTMNALNRLGYASVGKVTEFNDARGKKTISIKRPEKLQKSLFEVMKDMGATEKGWSVFGLSIMDGRHSVLISLDQQDTANPKLYWSDQWSSKGGWKEYSKTGLDNEVTRLTQAWWDKQPQTGKHDTRATLWRLYRNPQA